MKCPTCGSALESCGFSRSVTGLRWKHIDAVYFCESCAAFFTRTVSFLDGPMAKAGDLPGIREAETAAFHQAKTDWLKARVVA